MIQLIHMLFIKQFLCLQNMVYLKGFLLSFLDYNNVIINKFILLLKNYFSIYLVQRAFHFKDYCFISITPSDTRVPLQDPILTPQPK